MKSRESLIRLKRFQVDEKRRQVAQIEMMIADFERMAAELDDADRRRAEAAGISDVAHFAYPTFAKAAMQRRDNLLRLRRRPARPARRRPGRARRGGRGPEEGRAPRRARAGARALRERRRRAGRARRGRRPHAVPPGLRVFGPCRAFRKRRPRRALSLLPQGRRKDRSALQGEKGKWRTKGRPLSPTRLAIAVTARHSVVERVGHRAPAEQEGVGDVAQGGEVDVRSAGASRSSAKRA